MRRIASGVSEVRPLEGTPGLAQFLGELGLGGYHELGASAVLMVEGPTDVTAFQRILRLYRIEHQVVLLPLGGGSLINRTGARQLDEIRRLSPRIFAVIDSERNSKDGVVENVRLDFQASCASLEIPCHILDRRALENYFSQKAVETALGSAFTGLAEHEKLSEHSNAWAKSDNWRIAGEVTRDELDVTDLRKLPLASPMQ